MVTATTSITKAERSLAPDIARGMMLLFIALANVPIYMFGRPGDDYGHVADSSSLDSTLLGIEQLLIAERSRPMFAILYGFGIAMMASRYFARQLADGVPHARARTRVQGLLARRSLWLLALGAIHSTFLFVGDILAPYGATGLVALLFVVASDTAVKRWMIGSFVFTSLIGSPVLVAALTFAPEQEGGVMEPQNGATYAEQILFGLSGSIVIVLLSLLMALFVPLAAAGVLLQRRGWLTAPGDHLRGLTVTAVGGTAVGLVSALPVALVGWGLWEPSMMLYRLALWLTLVGGMLAGAAYICLFALGAHALRGLGRRGPVRVVAALGERSLTGYLTQSFLMAPVLSAWGLGLGDGLGYTQVFGYALAVWATTLGISWALDVSGRRGPFEVMLRRLVYGKPKEVAAPTPA